MYQFFVDDCQIGKEYVTITGSDVNHIKNVLRMRPGEKIRVSSSSRDMFCEIAELTDVIHQLFLKSSDCGICFVIHFVINSLEFFV